MVTPQEYGRLVDGSALPTESKEKVLKPENVAVVTATMYKNWKNPSERTAEEEKLPDNVRGDLAIQTCQAILAARYQLVLIDGGSSDSFKTELTKHKVDVRVPNRKGMSAERQEGFQIASQLNGSKYIVWMEPEKLDFVKSISEVVRPLLQNSADVVVPKRTKESFGSYPDYQVGFEQESNTLWNAFLRSRGLLKNDEENQDVWFGPRAFKNTPAVTALFQTQLRFDKRAGAAALDKVMVPGAYSNAIFFPVVLALSQGMRVENVEIPYTHPEEQTANEKDNDEFKAKRLMQQRQIVVLLKHLLDSLSSDEKRRGKSRLSV